MYDGANTIVLYDELAYQDTLPVAWRSLPGAVDPAYAASLAERNTRLLQACAAIEDHSPEREDDVAPELLRIDAKINLLLDLMGQLLTANRPRPTPVPVRFNTLGATWPAATATTPATGSQGLVLLYLRDYLPEALRLPGHITEVGANRRIKVRFAPLGEATADLMEKLIFRHHRRLVAGRSRSK